ncbi:hypothetical protein GRI39_02085 [Altererythrobacter indicus]|uniref:Uncharacterized protein n=1 Tax=Altericroceibacterium indicum TaxID=374177 RepID=A0A845A8E7_9SPHN|nr:hypothetical protein [Altericroceibacterium indicum]MXP24836.1 hypothetical protein [Altericroceibacterium indicum]
MLLLDIAFSTAGGAAVGAVVYHSYARLIFKKHADQILDLGLRNGDLHVQLLATKTRLRQMAEKADQLEGFKESVLTQRQNALAKAVAANKARAMKKRRSVN